VKQENVEVQSVSEYTELGGVPRISKSVNKEEEEGESMEDE
jgi:hypothetical protein